MKEKKTLVTRIKDFWNGLTPKDKGCIIGTIIGAAAATTGCVAGMRSGIKQRDEAWNQICDEESKAAYSRGIQDGRVKAYYDLLTTPDKAFKNMGMDVKKF